MTTGLAAGLAASALIRLAQARNGFAAVMAKGDPTAGTMLLLILQKGQFFGFFERQFVSTGSYSWAVCGPQTIENTQEIRDYPERCRARDPDLWIVELDVPDATQFIAELTLAG